MSAMARWICRLSVTMFLMRMMVTNPGSGSVGFGEMAGHDDIGVQSGHCGARRQLGARMAGQQVPYDVVVEAEAQDQLVAAGDFHQLSGRELLYDGGYFIGNT